jgi:hypothetical protein
MTSPSRCIFYARQQVVDRLVGQCCDTNTLAVPQKLDDRMSRRKCLARSRRPLDNEMRVIHVHHRVHSGRQDVPGSLQQARAIAQARLVASENARERAVVRFLSVDHCLCVALDRVALNSVVDWPFWNQ